MKHQGVLCKLSKKLGQTISGRLMCWTSFESGDDKNILH